MSSVNNKNLLLTLTSDIYSYISIFLKRKFFLENKISNLLILVSSFFFCIFNKVLVNLVLYMYFHVKHELYRYRNYTKNCFFRVKLRGHHMINFLELAQFELLFSCYRLFKNKNLFLLFLLKL